MYNPPEMGSGQDKEPQREEAVAQDKLNVSVRMEELMPLFIGQLKMLLGVPAHVSHRASNPSLISKPRSLLMERPGNETYALLKGMRLMYYSWE